MSIDLGKYVQSVRHLRSKRSTSGVDGPSLFDKNLSASLSVGFASGVPAKRAPRRTLGLSRSHTLTRLYVGGERLCLPKQARGPRRGGGKRSRSRGMSKNAKAVAVRCFKSIDQRRIESTWFMTNTLPSNFYCPIHEFKRILERYFARLTRAFGDRLAWYWAIEPTQAGQWHLHMIAFWVKDAPTQKARWLKFREWNDKAWHQATKVPDEAHLRAGCRIEAARSWKGVTCYLSGYLSPQKWSHYDGPDTGRVHGLRNGGILPVDPVDHAMTPRAVAMLRRLTAKLRSHRASGVFCYWLNEDGTVEKRQRQPGSFPREVDPQKERMQNKWLAETAMKNPRRLKLRRVRPRFYRNEAEWCDEFQIDRHGKQKHIGVRPVVEDEWGQPLKSHAFGPSELHIPWAHALRMIEWAVQEDRRRTQVQEMLPF